MLIAKPRIHLRGMNRNGVIVDGTKPGSSRCSRKPGAQDLGVAQDGSRIGRNGIVVYKASGVSIENLTACNFLAGDGENGNEIWWNGGDGTGLIGMAAFKGAYLNATSTFYNGDESARPGTGSSPATLAGRDAGPRPTPATSTTPATTMGACRQECNLTMRNGRGRSTTPSATRGPTPAAS